MSAKIETIKRMYDRFNARDVEGVLIELADDVAWANGMYGGKVYGRDGVREYWSAQWKVINPRVEPRAFRLTENDAVLVEAWQTIRDLDGLPLQGQDHGLKDRTVYHLFRFRGDKVADFTIQDGP